MSACQDGYRARRTTCDESAPAPCSGSLPALSRSPYRHVQPAVVPGYNVLATVPGPSQGPSAVPAAVPAPRSRIRRLLTLPRHRPSPERAR